MSDCGGKLCFPTPVLAIDNYNFPPFQLQKFTFNVKKFQTGKCK